MTSSTRSYALIAPAVERSELSMLPMPGISAEAAATLGRANPAVPQFGAQVCLGPVQHDTEMIVFQAETAAYILRPVLRQGDCQDLPVTLREMVYRGR